MADRKTYFDNCVYIDIETTGLNPQRDEIIEIGALKILKGEINSTFSTLVEPDRKISFWATKINGITNEMVKGAPKFKDAAREFIEFVGDMIVVAHNAKFDLSFLGRQIKESLNVEFSPKFIDTLKIARGAYPYAKSNSLKALSKRLEVDYSGAHRALGDCHITHLCIKEIRKRLE